MSEQPEQQPIATEDVPVRGQPPQGEGGPLITAEGEPLIYEGGGGDGAPQGERYVVVTRGNMRTTIVVPEANLAVAGGTQQVVEEALTNFIGTQAGGGASKPVRQGMPYVLKTEDGSVVGTAQRLLEAPWQVLQEHGASFQVLAVTLEDPEQP